SVIPQPISFILPRCSAKNLATPTHFSSLMSFSGNGMLELSLCSSSQRSNISTVDCLGNRLTILQRLSFSKLLLSSRSPSATNILKSREPKPDLTSIILFSQPKSFFPEKYEGIPSSKAP